MYLMIPLLEFFNVIFEVNDTLHLHPYTKAYSSDPKEHYLVNIKSRPSFVERTIKYLVDLSSSF